MEGVLPNLAAPTKVSGSFQLHSSTSPSFSAAPIAGSVVCRGSRCLLSYLVPTLFISMALLAKKLSFLPFMGLKAASPFMATYVSVSPAALRRNSANQNSAVNDEDESSTDEDEVMNVDQEVVYKDDGDENFPRTVPCKVMGPPRRPWATSSDETAIRFRLDMPGVAKENVKVYVDNKSLIVKGKYAPLKDEALDEEHVLADNVGVYTAEITLPDNVQNENIKSEMKDGMLLVTAPKGVQFIQVE